MAGIARGIGAEVAQPRAGTLDRGIDAGEHAAVAGNHQPCIELRDARQHRRLLGEAALAIQLGKDHAKAVFPQRIAGNQDARPRCEQHHRMRVMAWRGHHLPRDAAQCHHIAIVQHAVEAKAVALLPGGKVGERLGIPRGHGRGFGRGNRGARLPARLQRGVAATVIGMQVGVEDARQRPVLQRGRDQRHGLRRMRDVAGVDQRGIVAIDEQDVVGRQPAALEHAHGVGQRGHRCFAQGGVSSPASQAARRGSCAQMRRLSWSLADDQPAISSMVRRQPSQ
ncbi:hypothetical protein D9M69_486910 [compost metagenome]